MKPSNQNRKARLTLRHHMALLIHELLDIPLDRHQDPAVGQKIIRIIIKTMRDALLAGEDVSIPGFGIFRIIQGKARRTGNNFITDTDRSPVPLSHPSKKVVTFMPAEALTAMLNGPGNWGERRTISTWTDRRSDS